MKRIDGRSWDELRPVKITPGFQPFAEGSVLIEIGQTRVACTASIEDKVPPFLRGSGSGWVTAEYAMLPRATVTRTSRDFVQGRISGRNQEIQRLIGRSLRAVTDLSALGGRTFQVDCDVLQADGGTRTAAITGSYVALYLAMHNLANMGMISSIPFKCPVAAISAGIVHDNMFLDLCYDEDFNAGADFNIVMNGNGEFVEVQGTAEGKTYNKETLDSILSLSEKGINELFEYQKKALAAAGVRGMV
ncbi:MAG: ribonuclease PH [Dehalococcoidaceae bacterium]|nr:ribonuclease PH [Dehalococcoidaceae bacterium]